MILGAHVPPQRPLVEAEERGIDAVQLFLSNPQQWKPPAPRSDTDDLLASDVDIYVHAPYLMNLASANNRVRIPSRKTLAGTVDAAAAIGAKGVIVHGGSVGEGEDVSVGFERWRKALESIDLSVPILVENTAGTGTSVLHDLENYGPLWEEIGGFDVGVCLDTCHTWASGADMETAVDLIDDLVGGVTLVHCNDSRDEAGSNRDRHANLGSGMIPEDLLVGVVRAAGAPVILETPGGVDEHLADVAWLRERLGSGS
jgi:deoxyribonuclease-4